MKPEDGPRRSGRSRSATGFTWPGRKLLALDAATGATNTEVADTQDPREILVEGGLLLLSDAKAVRAFDLETLKLSWKADLDVHRMVSEGDGLFVVLSGRSSAWTGRRARNCGGRTKKTPRWSLTCTAHAGYLVLEKSTLRDDPIGCGIKFFSTKNGRTALDERTTSPT